MEIKTIISEQPKCKTCGKIMTEWNAWADEHEHIECTIERTSTSLIKIVKNQLKINKMKVTRPTEMESDLSQLEEAVKQFEEQWKQETKGLNYYHLVISSELNKETCKKVAELYTAAGWQRVQCKTSSDNGERAGLTGLILEYNTNH